MTAILETLVLAESTVQKVATGEVVKQRRPRGPDKRARQSVSIRQLSPAIMEAIEGVPFARVEVISDHEVIIWNHPAPWPRR